jgi:hypothetical protein
MTATNTTTVHEAWSAVMADVQGISKRERNDAQRFNFRGIDAVMNAVGPALRDHGVMVVPAAREITTESYSTAKGAAMRNATVLIDWTVYGPGGDSFTGASYGEAADAGDKAVSKAHSVAYRTFLLQALCIPTDEPDPDASSHERVAARPAQQSPADTARSELLTWARGNGRNPRDLADAHIATHGRGLSDEEDVDLIRAHMTSAA